LSAFQTAVKTSSPLMTFCYDLTIPLIVFLILMRSRLEACLCVFFAGVGVNMISGAPLGVYLITYIWLFMLFKNLKSYFHTPDSLLFVVLVVIGVMVEQLIFGMFYMIQAPIKALSLHAVYQVLLQIVIAGISGPFFFILFFKIFHVSDTLTFQAEQRT
jgi:cell shape-determining protein MreD